MKNNIDKASVLACLPACRLLYPTSCSLDNCKRVAFGPRGAYVYTALWGVVPQKGWEARKEQRKGENRKKGYNTSIYKVTSINGGRRRRKKRGGREGGTAYLPFRTDYCTTTNWGQWCLASPGWAPVDVCACARARACVCGVGSVVLYGGDGCTT